MEKIIAAGGEGGTGGPMNTVEVYDISLNTWETGVYDNDHIRGYLGKEHSQMSVYNSFIMFQVPASLIHLAMQLVLNMTSPSILLEDTTAETPTVIIS